MSERFIEMTQPLAKFFILRSFMLLRRAFEKSKGPYIVKHFYYQDGNNKTVMMNSNPMWNLMSNDGRARIEFTQHYHKLGKTFNISITPPPGYKYIECLDVKMVSRMGLDSRKTWFGTLETRVMISDRAYKNRKFISLVGFRRVPRKWVPELNALLIKEDK